MTKIRCYYKDAKGLHRVDVSDVDDYNEAVKAVQDLLWQGASPKTTVMAVVNKVAHA